MTTCYVWSEPYRAPQAKAPVDGTAGPPPLASKDTAHRPHRRAPKTKRRTASDATIEAVHATLVKHGPLTARGIHAKCPAVSLASTRHVVHMLEDDKRVVRHGTENTNGNPVIWRAL